MAGHKKPKVSCRCVQCGKEKLLPPSKAKVFKFCSNLCKWKGNEQVERYNKIPVFQYVSIKCANAFCENVMKVLPHVAKGKKYCCRICKDKVKSPEYIVLIEQQQKDKDKELKRRIWFV